MTDVTKRWIACSEEWAVERAEEVGYRVRITSRDGNHYVVTRDARSDRINFDIVDGLVARAEIG